MININIDININIIYIYIYGKSFSALCGNPSWESYQDPLGLFGPEEAQHPRKRLSILGKGFRKLGKIIRNYRKIIGNSWFSSFFDLF